MDDMNILISNDDGIFAPGIKKLACLLSKIKDADIYVCAPDRERSCVGQGLTLFDDLYLYDQPAEDFGPAVVWAKSCSGTPGDCVRLALSVLGMKGIKIDLVCAGINNGGNTGSDINYSGTFAACREAAIDGFPGGQRVDMRPIKGDKVYRTFLRKGGNSGHRRAGDHESRVQLPAEQRIRGI